MTPLLVDTHAHPWSKAFTADRAAVLERAHAASVGTIIVVGCDPASNRESLAMARASAEREARSAERDGGCGLGERLPSGEPDTECGAGDTDKARQPVIWATTGIHPHDAKDATEDDWDELAAMAVDPRVVALGEMGLDFFRNISPHDVQREVLRRQLSLCSRFDLPAVIHSRDAQAATWEILESWARARRRDGGTEPFGVMHCYAYDLDAATRYVDLGFMISIPGTVTYPSNRRGQEVARGVPADALVIETDCPYLTPQSRRGKRNEPAYIVETLEFVAAQRGEAPGTVAALTTANARRLFRLDEHERHRAVEPPSAQTKGSRGA